MTAHAASHKQSETSSSILNLLDANGDGRLREFFGLKRLKILLTAFGSFPGVRVNSGAVVLEKLNDKILGNFAHKVQRTFLRTSYEFCEWWIPRTLADNRFDLIVHLGVAPFTRSFRLETTASNRVSRRLKDSDGHTWRTKIIDREGPAKLVSSIAGANLSEDLTRRGLPVLLSDDAGDYLCNFLYYKSLRFIEIHNLPTAVLFLHMPPIRIGSFFAGGFFESADMHLAVLQTLLTSASERWPIRARAYHAPPVRIAKCRRINCIKPQVHNDENQCSYAERKVSFYE